MKWQSKKGFTLVEILGAILILVFAGVAILETFTASIHFSVVNRERTTAMADLGNMMEAIISTPFSNIPTNFPNGIQDGVAGNRYVNIIGNYTLRNEHISVTYVNATSDPLEINVTLSWKDAKNATQTNVLITKVTR